MASSDAATVPHPEIEPSAGSTGPIRSAGTLLFRLLAGTIVVASFGVWVYIYSGQADRPPPDLFVDTELADQAEAICAAAVDDVDAMPSASQAADAADRADQVRRSTARFEAMVTDLEALPVDEPDDRVIMSGWLADWRTLLDDRLRYADAVVEDPDALFTLTNVAAGERLDRRLTRVANTNLMTSCAAPTDVG